MGKPQDLILVHGRAPGDIVAMTGLVRDIALTYPKQFAVTVATHHPPIWRNNPHIVEHYKVNQVPRNTNAWVLTLNYKAGLNEHKYRPLHFLAHWHENFNRSFKTDVKVHFPYPDLHLSAEEKASPPVSGRYWVVVSGGKADAPVKVWSGPYMQRVVDMLAERGITTVQIGTNHVDHFHHKLTGVVNLIDRTDLRDMMRVIAGADGVICGVTAAMHMAAGFHKPCVVLAGGRESWWWVAYNNENRGFGPQANGKFIVPHRFIHTIDMLDCCRAVGCWRDVVVHTAESRKKGRRPCVKPVFEQGQLPLPACMTLIKPELVVEAVMGYYTDHSVRPLTSGATVALQEPPSTPPAPAAFFTEPVPQPKRKVSFLNLFDDDDPPAAPPTPPAMSTTPASSLKSVVIVAPPPLEIDPRLMAKEVRPLNPGPHANAAPPAVTAAKSSGDPADVVFDHKDVGGRFTVFVMMYGPEAYYDMHERCLKAIIASIPPSRMDLRIGSNALNVKSLAMVESMVAAGVVTKHYRNPENRFKYPVMRDMFHDPSHPITTKWVLWFDDDVFADVNPKWLHTLAQMMAQHHAVAKVHMFGRTAVHPLNLAEKRHFMAQPWWKHKPWHDKNGKPSVKDGNFIHFCAGWFWALTNEAIKACDIPCRTIGHNGGDWTIGEQLYQNGFGIHMYNARKEFLYTEPENRRGVTTNWPGRGDTHAVVEWHDK